MKKLMILLLWVFSVSLAQSQTLKPVAKIQGFSAQSAGIFDSELHSPKSVSFSPDGGKIYINALESGKTLVYAYPSLKKLTTIHHQFDATNQHLFYGQKTVFHYSFPPEVNERLANEFVGKPVEMAWSHGGKYLWVPYYRRSTDPRSAGPSALAIIDTTLDKIVRVIPTGPLPKFIAINPQSNQAVVVHWGDNTLMRIDMPQSNPQSWVVAQHWTVEQQLNTASVGKDRDRQCGYCLRGAVFTVDGRYVLVARMGGGGLAGFEAATGQYLGTIRSIAPTPRHLVLSKNGQILWITSNVSGVLTQVPIQRVLDHLLKANGKTVDMPRGEELSVGYGARTVSVDTQERFAYVATNTARKIAVVDLKNWRVVSTQNASPFPVGLAVSPDGCVVASTSQGRAGQGGGNAVDIFDACEGR